jgi:hypothetical protein
MDELLHFCIIANKGEGVSEMQLIRRAQELVPAMSVTRVLEIMERGGMIKVMAVKKGIRFFTAGS